MNKKTVFLGSVPFLCMAVFFYIIYLLSGSYSSKSVNIKARKGELIIPNGFNTKLISISGEFYFTPEQFYSLTDITKESYGKVPGSFKDTSLNSRFGYGSYGLRIYGLNPNMIYTLQVGRALSSCSIVINSKDVLQQGQPGISKDMEIPGVKSSQAAFRPRSNGTADIILNISNFRNRKGGFSSPLILGQAKDVEQKFHFDLILSSAIFAAIFAIAVFFFLLPFFYKKTSFIWWFALASTISATRSIFFYPNIQAFLFPLLSWQAHFICRYATFPLLVLFFTVFIKKALNIYFKIPYIAILIVSTLYTLSIIILEPEQSVTVLPYYQFFSIGCIVYNIFIVVLALIKKAELGLWIFTSVAVLVLFGVYDLLVVFGIITAQYNIQVASFIAVNILSVMILNRYSNSIKKLEALNKEIKAVNKSLARFFPDMIIKLLNKDSITDIRLGDNAELKMPIVSIDIRSFTHISEKLSPDQVFNLLNAYFALVVPIIRENGGIVTKYLGDGFFALFPGGADPALQCAIKIQKEIKEKKIIPPNCDPIKVGIGIDFDNLLLGTIGDKTRMDSIIISNAYYLSEILQRQTKVYGASIIISERIFKSLENPNRYRIRPLQTIKTDAVGKNFSFEVYDSDDEEIKNLKRQSQDDLEHGLQAFFVQKDPEDANTYFNKVLEVFPDDNLAIRYKKILEKYRDEADNSNGFAHTTTVE